MMEWNGLAVADDGAIDEEIGPVACITYVISNE